MQSSLLTNSTPSSPSQAVSARLGWAGRYAEWFAVGAILLECSELPAYSAAVQAAVRLPVFDYMTMLDQLYASVAQRAYRGSVY